MLVSTRLMDAVFGEVEGDRVVGVDRGDDDSGFHRAVADELLQRVVGGDAEDRRSFGVLPDRIANGDDVHPGLQCLEQRQVNRAGPVAGADEGNGEGGIEGSRRHGASCGTVTGHSLPAPCIAIAAFLLLVRPCNGPPPLSTARHVPGSFRMRHRRRPEST